MLLELMRLFVKLIWALMPSTGLADSAVWIAFGSEVAGGTGPLSVAAIAIAVPPAATTTTAAMSARRRRVETVRRNLMTTHLRIRSGTSGFFKV